MPQQPGAPERSARFFVYFSVFPRVRSTRGNLGTFHSLPRCGGARGAPQGYFLALRARGAPLGNFLSSAKESHQRTPQGTDGSLTSFILPQGCCKSLNMALRSHLPCLAAYFSANIGVFSSSVLFLSAIQPLSFPASSVSVGIYTADFFHSLPRCGSPLILHFRYTKKDCRSSPFLFSHIFSSSSRAIR